jgi:hypothetical protein
MDIKSKLVGFAAAAVMTFGIAGSVFAATAPTQQVNLTINPGTEFSVAFDSASNYGAANFNLTNVQYLQAGYTYTVKDGRGTGDGWNVKASTPGLVRDANNAVVANANFHATNLTYWQDNTGFTADAGSITTGVSATSSWTPLLNGTGRVLLQAAPSTGVTPNGTGVFHSGDALYLDLPSAVAAGSYHAVLTLTLTSGQP